MKTAYHYGDLRSAVLARAVEVIEAHGPDSFSLRSLAADLGVSHTAPRHHFGSREGVLTAVAAQGFDLLADRLHAARTAGSLLDAGVAYVAFAREHPGHFAVMFTPTLVDGSDPELAAARRRAFGELRGGVRAMHDGQPTDDDVAVLVASWAIVHGIATLALSGSFDASELAPLVAGRDLLDLTRRSAALLYPGTPADLTTPEHVS